MALNVYEGFFIFDSNLYSRDPAGVSGQLASIIEKEGGEMLASRMWEERRLAYPIDGHKKGTYWLSYFRLDSLKLPAITRSFQLSDSILRQLVLKVEPRLVEAMVAHATGARIEPVGAVVAVPPPRRDEGGIPGVEDEV